jgi:hypothetical protein
MASLKLAGIESQSNEYDSNRPTLTAGSYCSTPAGLVASWWLMTSLKHSGQMDCQPGCIFAVKGLPGFPAVAGHQHFMSPFGQHDLHHVPGNRIIFRQ